MSGYTIAEIWCDLPRCDTPRRVAEDVGTLRGLRAVAREQGWVRRRATDADLAEPVSTHRVGDLIDVCPDCLEWRAT